MKYSKIKDSVTTTGIPTKMDSDIKLPPRLRVLNHAGCGLNSEEWGSGCYLALVFRHEFRLRLSAFFSIKNHDTKAANNVMAHKTNAVASPSSNPPNIIRFNNGKW